MEMHHDPKSNSGSDADKKTLLLIFPGPIYDPVEFYQARLDTLASTYQGIVFTSSPSVSRWQTGNFLIITKRFYVSKLTEFISLSFASYKLARELNKKNQIIDLIVSYDPLRSGLVGIFLKKKLRTKLLVEVNGIYDDPANFIDNYNRAIGSIRLKAFKFVEQLVLNRADGIKLLFNGQVDNFLKKISHRPLVRSFANMVDVQRFLDTPADLSSKKVLFVGSPHFLKGADLIITAFNTLTKEFPDWELTILSWYPDLSVLDRALQNTRNINYHPAVTPAEMPGHLAMHSILALPSRAEAMGRILVEGMAAGNARIGSRQGGIPTVIEDGVDGLLCENDNAADLANCLRKLMKSEQLREKYGHAGRLRALANFNNDQYFTNTDNFYQEIINKS